eukprot:CAMPEP_0174988374 /NCGR_PEP_ID=MMETSP0004_2-20121128/20091_1 /TAXON_ID=420556 /ORGANISM="Ochromonas sp., Strain CCMP1393" /LENGTH=96 /DNA_ID=CAMNT_0016241585 /DNA_START=174 /DNA_END=464 /DNA_ORIENTATION=+
MELQRYLYIRSGRKDIQTPIVFKEALCVLHYYEANCAFLDRIIEAFAVRPYARDKNFFYHTDVPDVEVAEAILKEEYRLTFGTPLLPMAWDFRLIR